MILTPSPAPRSTELTSLMRSRRKIFGMSWPLAVNPFGRDRGARGIERHRPAADFFVEGVLVHVLDVRRARIGHRENLRPQIVWIGRMTAKLQRDEVVFLVIER